MKNANIIIRISEREKELIKKRADELDMTLSEYILALFRADEATKNK